MKELYKGENYKVERQPFISLRWLGIKDKYMVVKKVEANVCYWKPITFRLSLEAATYKAKRLQEIVNKMLNLENQMRNLNDRLLAYELGSWEDLGKRLWV